MISRPETRELAERLIDLLEQARPVPLMPSRVRVDKDDVDELVKRISSGPDAFGHGPDGDTAADADIVRAAQAAQNAVHHAKQVPLTDQVRLPREQAKALADALRAALAA